MIIQEFGSFELILIVGALEGLVIAVILLLKKGQNIKANRLLASLLLLLVVSIVLHLFGNFTPETLRVHPAISTVLTIWMAPLLFQYVSVILHLKTHTVLRNAAGGLLLFLSIIYIFLSLFAVKAPGSQFVALAGEGITLTSILLFSVLSIVILSAKKRKPQENGSPGTMHFRWLRFLVAFFLVFWIIAFIVDRLKPIPSWDIPLTVSSLMILCIGNYGFFQPALFWGTARLAKPALDKTGQYLKSGLPEWRADYYLKKLKASMKTGKLYADPGLTLRSLSQHLNIRPHHLSRIINERMGTGFYEYINALRVEAARGLLGDIGNADIGIAEISGQAGFNTLSTFNTSFKRMVGVTPSEFRKTALEKSRLFSRSAR